MQKLIVVEGKKNSGKTEAIKVAGNLLGCGITMNSPADIFIVTYLKFKNRVYGIGIASDGDSASVIKDNIDALYPHHLDYVITACSTPQAGAPLLSAFATIEGAQLITLPSGWLPSATAQQVTTKVTALAQQIRSHIP